MNELTKKCSSCQQVLSITEFGNAKNKKDGHQSNCKKCGRERTKKRYHSDITYHNYILDKMHKRYESIKKDPEKQKHSKEIYRKAWRKYRKTHKDKINTYQRAKYQLDKTDLVEQIFILSMGKCEVCHKEVEKVKGKYAIHHKNGNQFDNRLENLSLVCTKHHLHTLHQAQTAGIQKKANHETIII